MLHLALGLPLDRGGEYKVYGQLGVAARSSDLADPVHREGERQAKPLPSVINVSPERLDLCQSGTVRALILPRRILVAIDQVRLKVLAGDVFRCTQVGLRGLVVE